MPGESSATPRKRRLKERVPEEVWTLEKWARAGLVYVIAALFLACLFTGGGVKPCATAACQSARALMPVPASAASSSSGSLSFATQ